jgi:hypothetical protein
MKPLLRRYYDINPDGHALYVMGNNENYLADFIIVILTIVLNQPIYSLIDGGRGLFMAFR